MPNNREQKTTGLITQPTPPTTEDGKQASADSISHEQFGACRHHQALGYVLRWLDRTLRGVNGALREVTSRSAPFTSPKSLFTQRRAPSTRKAMCTQRTAPLATVYYEQVAPNIHG